MSVSANRVLVALHLPENAEALVLKTRAIVDKMTGNSWFPQPSPTLAKVLAAAEALHDAQIGALRRTKGLPQKRNEARAALVNLLKQLKAYVEGVANDSPEHAVSIIESAGLDAVLPTHAEKAPFAVEPYLVSGQVLLRVKAGPKGCTYYFQRSTDGGETWEDLEPTKKAETIASGLVPGKTYWFRFRILGRRGFGDWSDKLSIVAR